MQLTLFTDYGLRTLIYLAAHNDKLSSVKEIAEHYDISRNHLAKVVHRLSQLEYIETTKGKGGGILISKSTTALRLGDLIVALEPNMNMVECFDDKTNTCRITQTCQLKHYLYEARQGFIDKMNQYTLVDTIANTKSRFSISSDNLL
jgi:Rrf2 family nitric oxide-sensitive transcriptional repressor